MCDKLLKEFLERTYCEVMTLSGHRHCNDAMRLYFAGVAAGLGSAYVGTKLQSLEENIKSALAALRVEDNVFRHQIDRNWDENVKNLYDAAKAGGDDTDNCVHMFT